MTIQSKKIKIAGEGLCLSDRKKVSGGIASKKKAVQQTNRNNLMESGSSAINSLADSFKGELLIQKKDEMARMRVASVDCFRFAFENW